MLAAYDSNLAIQFNIFALFIRFRSGAYTITTSDFADVIGVFTGCSNVKTQNTRGGAKTLWNIYINDGRYTDVLIYFYDNR